VPLSQVAYAAGFADQSHLTRTFRRATGYTPGLYRRLRGADHS
jgi:AraC-like DNA-binding protein